MTTVVVMTAQPLAAVEAHFDRPRRRGPPRVQRGIRGEEGPLDPISSADRLIPPPPRTRAAVQRGSSRTSKNSPARSRRLLPVPATIRPRMVVADVDDAVTYYETCLGARRGLRLAEPSGHIVHAELRIGDSDISLTQSRDEWGLLAPDALGGSPLLLTLTVDDASTVGAAMVAAGGTVVIPIEDRPYGKREGRVRDPFGHLWIVSQDLTVAG